MSRALVLAALAIVALAASVAAQNCVVTVLDYGTDSTCASLNTSTAVTQGNVACPSTNNFQYLQAQCTGGFTTDSAWIVDVWSPAQGGCTGAYAGRAQGSSFSQCSTYNAGTSVAVNTYFRVNCSCVAVIPAVSSSSASPVSSSSAGSTGLSSSVAPIDYGCSRTVNQYADSTCATGVTATFNPLSRVCTQFASFNGVQYYINLQCASSDTSSNWAAAVYASPACTGTIATVFTSDSTAPNRCETGQAVTTSYYINVNCSCALGGRRYSSTGIISSTGLTGVSGATSSVTSGVTGASGVTSRTSTGITGNTGSTGSSTTGSSSDASVSRSGVVAIVAAVAAGVMALVA